MNAAIRRAVFFDFDGVLFDTAREAYAVAMVALGNSVRIADIDFSSRYFEKLDQGVLNTLMLYFISYSLGVLFV